MTLPFLELGAQVTAVDISRDQLAALKRRCEPFSDRLEIRCEDIWVALQDTSQQYDIVVASSLLHHIPDYLTMLERVLGVLAPHGQFFSFQDPMRYDTMGRLALAFSNASLLLVADVQG